MTQITAEDIEKSIKILPLHNKWRRDEDGYEMQNPRELGLAIDTACQALLLAAKVLEPSDEMVFVVNPYSPPSSQVRENFKAMIQQALKEIDQ